MFDNAPPVGCTPVGLSWAVVDTGLGPVEWLWRSLVELKALPFRMRGQVKP